MKKILYISGTRADYGLMRGVLRRIDESPDMTLEVIATGMHLMPEFGNSVEEIAADGFTIHRLPVIHEEDTRESMAVFIGNIVGALTEIVRKIRPDLILLLGDRGEMLAGAIVGNYAGIPVAHIHGGEVTSTVDEPVRHAITKLTHIHLPATRRSAQRIIRMGEDPARVHVVGAPGLEPILAGAYTSKNELCRKYRIQPDIPLVLVVQHPVSAEIVDAGRQMQATLEAVSGLPVQALVVYPNADAGGRQMIGVIEEVSKKYPRIQCHRNLPHDDYLGLLKIASVLVGNSSSGIIEAPSFHLPVVNIGSRQEGRERAGNIIETGYSEPEIATAIGKALYDQDFRHKVKRCRNPYGKGNSSQKIVDVLRHADFKKIGTQKKNFY
jgi:UDP-hydrolysing UDP-N-acetyl-D-glucosamine 2-epimerase